MRKFVIRATVFEHPDQADYLSLTTNEMISAKPLSFLEVGSTTKKGFGVEVCRKWFPDFSERTETNGSYTVTTFESEQWKLLAQQ